MRTRRTSGPDDQDNSESNPQPPVENQPNPSNLPPEEENGSNNSSSESSRLPSPTDSELARVTYLTGDDDRIYPKRPVPDPDTNDSDPLFPGAAPYVYLRPNPPESPVDNPVSVEVPTPAQSSEVRVLQGQMAQLLQVVAAQKAKNETLENILGSVAANLGRSSPTTPRAEKPWLKFKFTIFKVSSPTYDVFHWSQDFKRFASRATTLTDTQRLEMYLHHAHEPVLSKAIAKLQAAGRLKSYEDIWGLRRRRYSFLYSF